MRRPPRATSTQRGRLRIISGAWRGRKIEFRAAEGLRPTPDRVRETLFNWLQPALHGARCLDLFCGSGALGLEALSRGAAAATFVDRSPAVIEDLQRNVQRLGAAGAAAIAADALAWLIEPPPTCYDIVFLDPPYRQGLVARCAGYLGASALLKAGAFVYTESGVDEPVPDVPAAWAIHREKTAGQIAYRLYIVTPG